jgi:hypothetical protein
MIKLLNLTDTTPGMPKRWLVNTLPTTGWPHMRRWPPDQYREASRRFDRQR